MTATGSGSISLNSAIPAGIGLSFDSNPVKVSTGVTLLVQMAFTVAQNVTPGDYKVAVTATSGSISESTTFTVRVVQYLLLMHGNAFVPASLTVKAGSTVYWIDKDSPAGGDPEIHNVVFTAGGTNVQSPNMKQYDTYSYTFTAPGTYNHACAFHPGMKGTITVTS